MKSVTQKLGVLLLACSFHFGVTACSGDDQQMEEEVQQGYEQQGEQSAQGQQGQQGDYANQQEEGQQYADQNGNMDEGNSNYNPEQGNLENNQLAQEDGEYEEQGQQGYEGEEGDAVGYNDMGNDAGDEDLQAILNEVNNEGGDNSEETVEDMTNQQVQETEVADQGYEAPAAEGDATMAANQSAPMDESVPMNNGTMMNNAQPAAATAAAPIAGSLPEDGTAMAYVVMKGDTLGTIAQKVYGNQGRWRDIAGASNLADPNRIYAGDVIYYTLDASSRSFAERYESAPMTVVTAQAGDSLHKIAERVYGNASSWVFLWRHNGSIDNPDVISAGAPIFFVQPEAMNAAAKSLEALTAYTNAKLAKKSA